MRCCSLPIGCGAVFDQASSLRLSSDDRRLCRCPPRTYEYPGAYPCPDLDSNFTTAPTSPYPGSHIIDSSASKATKILKRCDLDGNGRIDKREFAEYYEQVCRAMSKLQQAQEADPWDRPGSPGDSPGSPTQAVAALEESPGDGSVKGGRVEGGSVGREAGHVKTLPEPSTSLEMEIVTDMAYLASDIENRVTDVEDRVTESENRISEYVRGQVTLILHRLDGMSAGEGSEEQAWTLTLNLY